MIKATFFHSQTALTGFSLSGHAGYADCGEDIVCAAVTSAVQLTANALTEVLRIPAQVSVKENEISVSVKDATAIEAAQPFFEALKLQLMLLAEDYENTIELSE